MRRFNYSIIRLIALFVWLNINIGAISGTDGSLDRTFNQIGNFSGLPGVELLPLGATFGAGTTTASIRGVAIQADGKILLAGNADPGGVVSMAVVRLLPLDGSLDKSFGVGGVVIISPTDFGAGATQASASSIQVASDGTIVIGGFADPASIGGPSMAVARITSTGLLDNSFGSGTGTFAIPLADFGVGTFFTIVNDLVLDSNNNIICAGNAFSPAGAGSNPTISVARITSTGILDTSFNPAPLFGTPGILTLTTASFGGGTANAGASAVRIDANGKIVVVGSSASLVVVRINNNGSLDSTFNPVGAFPGDPGIETIPFAEFGDVAFAGGSTLAIDDQGRLVVAGTVLSNDAGGFAFAVLRLISSDGSLDATFNSSPSFGSPGILTIPIADFGAGTSFAGVSQLAIQVDGKIVVVGRADPVAVGGGSSYAIVRLRDDSSFDSTFNPIGSFPGIPGIETIPLIYFGSGISSADLYDLAIQSDGKIVLGGESNSRFAIARLSKPIVFVQSCIAQATHAKYCPNFVPFPAS